ncbi:hypothetical protein OY671_008193, partial [Metschnikowia pulcherrima]
AGILQHHAAPRQNLRQRGRVPVPVPAGQRTVRGQLCRPRRQIHGPARSDPAPAGGSAVRHRSLWRDRVYRAARGAVPCAGLWTGRAASGDGRAQCQQAGRGARCDRRADQHAADRGRCRRSRQPHGHGGAGAGGGDDGRPLPALWRTGAGRSHRGGNRLCRLVRRAGVDAPDGGQVRRGSEAHRRAGELLLGLRFDPVRSGRADAAKGGRGPLRGARAARERPGPGDEGRRFGRNRGQSQGHARHAGPASRTDSSDDQRLRPDAGFRRAAAA